MAGAERLICAAADLRAGDKGVRFEAAGQAAFAVRWQGEVFGWLNQCRHVALELDWNPGRFFDDSGLYLICATHGALYEPDTGLCVSGPCHGRALFPIQLVERDGYVYLVET
ncbi:MAG: Rieske 2Fe-2S domain-containing protein [Uliginosibacterium sp.]|nr:Rieske 2Fe-2S domain-containing protein [Uliginosibacterium sp.]